MKPSPSPFPFTPSGREIALLVLFLLPLLFVQCGEAPPAIITFNDALERFPHDKIDSIRTPGGLQVTYHDLKWPHPEDSALSALWDQEMFRTETRVYFDDSGALTRIRGIEHIYDITDSSATPPAFSVRDSVIMELLPEK